MTCLEIIKKDISLGKDFWLGCNNSTMEFNTYLQIVWQSCKLLRHLGPSCPVALQTSSRILKVYPTLFAMSRILKVTSAHFGYFGHFRTDLDIYGLILDISILMLADFVYIWTDFG